MGMADAKSVVTPFKPGADLTPGAPGVSVVVLAKKEHVYYWMGAGLLQYLVMMTRTDLCYYTNVLLQFLELEAPTKTHFAALKRMWCYIANSIEYMLILGGKNFDSRIVGWCDSDSASAAHCGSIAGNVFFVGSGAISWSSKKQTIIALSSTEVKYVALTHAAKQLVWLHQLGEELFHSYMKTKVVPDWSSSGGRAR